MHMRRPKLQLLVAVRAVVTKVTRSMRRMTVTTHHMYFTMVGPVEAGKLVVCSLVVFSSLSKQPTHKMLVARVAHSQKYRHVTMLRGRNA